MKICNRCKKEKKKEDYHKHKGLKDGYFTICKECRSSESKIYYEKNKERIKNYLKIYRAKNKKKRKTWYKKNREREINRVYEWRLKKYGNKKEKRRKEKELQEVEKKKRLEHKLFMNNYGRILSNTIRIKYHRAFKLKKYTQPKDRIKVLGCSLKEFKNYVESKFFDDMNWSNYGHGGWIIVFIKQPTQSKNKKEFLELCKYSNLTPIWEDRRAS